jgi:isopentenyldiphosphate isomerase
MAKQLSQSDRAGMQRLLKENFDRKVEELLASRPTHVEEVDDAAEQMAADELGIGAEWSQLQRLERRRDRLDEEIEQVVTAATKKARRRKPASMKGGNLYISVCSLAETLKTKASERTAIGRKLIGLQEQYDARRAQLMQCETRDDVREAGVLNHIAG